MLRNENQCNTKFLSKKILIVYVWCTRRLCCMRYFIIKLKKNRCKINICIAECANTPRCLWSANLSCKLCSANRTAASAAASTRWNCLICVHLFVIYFINRTHFSYDGWRSLSILHIRFVRCVEMKFFRMHFHRAAVTDNNYHYYSSPKPSLPLDIIRIRWLSNANFFAVTYTEIWFHLTNFVCLCCQSTNCLYMNSMQYWLLINWGGNWLVSAYRISYFSVLNVRGPQKKMNFSVIADYR